MKRRYNQWVYVLLGGLLSVLGFSSCFHTKKSEVICVYGPPPEEKLTVDVDTMEVEAVEEPVMIED